MTTEEIAQAMLEILSEEKDWARYDLIQPRDDGVAHCLLGARAAVQGLTLTGTADVLRLFHDDEYLCRLATVIREQYPDVPLIHGISPAGNIIYHFNDYAGISFADIRLVLEKAAVK